MRSRWIGLILLGMLSNQSQANEWVRNIEVVQIGAYQATTDHFVWFTITPAECQTADPARPILRFNEARQGIARDLDDGTGQCAESICKPVGAIFSKSI